MEFGERSMLIVGGIFEASGPAPNVTRKKGHEKISRFIPFFLVSPDID